MSFFSVALHAAMSAREQPMSQTDLANLTGVQQGQISRYLSGSILPDDSALSRLCKALPDHVFPLLRAYLQDHTPAPMRKLVRIEPAGDSAASAKSSPHEELLPLSDDLPPKARKVLLAVAARCRQQPAFISLLESALKITGE